MNIKPTPEQVQQILAPQQAQHEKDLAAERKTHSRAYMARIEHYETHIGRLEKERQQWKNIRDNLKEIPR
jgi:hypothetical protein